MNMANHHGNFGVVGESFGRAREFYTLISNYNCFNPLSNEIFSNSTYSHAYLLPLLQ